MSESKRFVFLQLAAENQANGLEERLEEGLRQRGASVERLPLSGNYDAVLDRLAEGAVPVVLK